MAVYLKGTGQDRHLKDTDKNLQKGKGKGHENRCAQVLELGWRGEAEALDG